MKTIFDDVSNDCSKIVTKTYSTSFSLATKMLSKGIRQHIYNIYGFVRFADEIVDSFHDYDKEALFKDFSSDLEKSLKNKIHLNPILNSFQATYHKFNIDKDLVDSFMSSMKKDLYKTKYLSNQEYEDYIYGSADVVGLMCLKVFVNGDSKKYEELKSFAMRLGSAFQKVNFLRDLKDDFEVLNRTYFPNTDLNQLDEESKIKIIDEIEGDFKEGLNGIKKLPIEAKFGVFMAYRYYSQLLKKLKKTPALEIKNTRIRVPNYKKIELLTRSYVKYQLNLL
ncbi:phytoene/squalene synthase family protein [Flavobacteriaceae bacterium]|nr:phytoene synthase [Flavobacteriaceae bacterium]MDB3937794.1 phytoene/squalene synthase family protein [Flavobacteriaceae bacterium]MDC1108574.1 phytoene/squalene synthase family protein [Flavobacteriaceae bacterium]RZP00950.1 MAG: phytoene/squalene synthase family protein [Flavobacteriales bacterium]|tara:strand:- start:1684 stop:2523 length:840 start_codon:yes stop_codon:yes gene_type:complete